MEKTGGVANPALDDNFYSQDEHWDNGDGEKIMVN